MTDSYTEKKDLTHYEVTGEVATPSVTSEDIEAQDIDIKKLVRKVYVVDTAVATVNRPHADMLK